MEKTGSYDYSECYFPIGQICALEWIFINSINV